jgi:hypothetical protein
LSVKAWVQAEKMRRGCHDCGYAEHPAALDFDHLPGEVKLFALSACWGRTLEEVQAEVAKCEVRCSNCHRVVTWLRHQGEIAGHLTIKRQLALADEFARAKQTKSGAVPTRSAAFGSAGR